MGVPELIRYCDIHPNISVHSLWKIAYVHPNFKIMLSSIIKIGSMKQFRRQCNLCNKQTLDFSTHILLHCEQLTTERNSAFELLANNVLDSVTKVMNVFELYSWWRKQ